MIPVTVVTGALGSGKTTLIGRTLRDPAFGRTAVIVNEFGAIPLDHDLIASADESVLTLATGCLCCTVQTDLARTMLDLAARRDAGELVYDRVLVETSGLADPAPLMQALLGDAAIAATHRVPLVVTLVDAVHGEAALDERPEARRQVALADRLLISKTDLCPASRMLLDRLAGLNPQAPQSAAGQLDLFGDPAPIGLATRLRDLPGPAGHADLESFVLTLDRPMPALALTLLLQALAEHCGRRLLRLKGLVAIAEMPGQPAVIHGVRHVVAAPDFLPAWPSEDQTTRIVFIGQGIPRWFPARLLAAIEEEVRDAVAA
ncbi:MAG TPA: GTP-binding protein [Rhodopila sp.]|uniref:CobW family GTP-binding protein n=1 Tax=Rhodopila sp. TaxID=2480087 RepID=UPI002C20F870|nr:GTP-binding protein [Rhodopila sp.]HVY15079.1 GTP-binding protein [Rhodopila sp.]